MRLLSIALTSLLLFLTAPGWAQTLPAAYPCNSIMLKADIQQISPLSRICFLEDKTNSLGLQDILKGDINLVQSDQKALVFSHSDSTYWVILPLHNTQAETASWFLELPYAPLDRVEFFVLSPAGSQHTLTGDRQAFNTRAVDYRFYVQPLLFAAHEKQVVIIKVKSTGAINIPLALHRPGSLMAASNSLSLANGLFYGGILILTLFNTLLFLSTREFYYLSNAFYMMCTGLFLFSMSGLAYQYLWPNSSWVANIAIPLTEALAVLSFTLFGYSFLGLETVRNRAYRIIALLSIINAINISLALLLPYQIIIKWITLFALISISALFVVGLLRWREGYAPAKWYVLSWALMFVGTGVYALGAFGYIANYLANETFMQIAVCGQVLLLNYALLKRWRFLIDQVIAVQTHAKLQLEVQVHERTAQLRHTMRELEAANRKLEELSTRDKLTNLYNRRYFDDALRQALSEARRLQQPLSLLLLDADHFKPLNDNYGHLFGDECLVKIAQVLTDNIRRPRDTIARYGGEEFAVILPNTEINGALHLADQILNAMRSEKLEPNPEQQITLTLSAGATCIYPHLSQHSPQSLLAMADTALYRAKHAGRDCVMTNKDTTTS